MLIKTRLQGYLNKVYVTAAGIWSPMFNAVVPKHMNVLAVLSTPQGRILIPSHNIITDNGDLYYAQRMGEETVTNDFNSLYLMAVAWAASHPSKVSTTTNIASIIGSSEKATSATYPKTNDGDADNTGAGTDILSWLFSYTKADFNNGTIVAGAVARASVPAWGSGGDPLLTAFAFTSFSKTANDTLKVFVNHQANGV